MESNGSKFFSFSDNELAQLTKSQEQDHEPTLLMTVYSYYCCGDYANDKKRKSFANKTYSYSSIKYVCGIFKEKSISFIINQKSEIFFNLHASEL